MRPLVQDDLIPQTEYERRRQDYRRHIIALKQRRRISVGEYVTLVFENRATVQFQIQEMLRVERITEPDKIQDELDVYNAMLPGDGELSATLLIEITDEARMKELLDAFKGIDRGCTVALRVGRETVFAEFEGGHSNEEKISAVHFIRFRPDAAFIDALASGQTPVVVTVQHGPYQDEAGVPDGMREEWLADLQPEPLSQVGL